MLSSIVIAILEWYGAIKSENIINFLYFILDSCIPMLVCYNIELIYF